jgi:hypothetical protein
VTRSQIGADGTAAVGPEMLRLRKQLLINVLNVYNDGRDRPAVSASFAVGTRGKESSREPCVRAWPWCCSGRRTSRRYVYELRLCLRSMTAMAAPYV